MHIAPWARFSRFAQTSTLATVMALALSGLAGCGSNGHDGGATSLQVAGPVLSGTGAPQAYVGADGDYFLDAATGRLYGPKVAGAWPTASLALGGTANGPAGTPASSLLSGSAAPNNALGRDGDFYIDTAGRTIYGPKAGGAWPASGIAVVGPAGPVGATGATGAPGAAGAAGATGVTGATGTTGAIGATGPAGTAGASFLSGAAAPDNAVGADGDFYLNTTSNILRGPKAAGAWPATGVSLVGATGPSGPSGATGTTGTNGTNGSTILSGTTNPAASVGVDGDFYLNTVTSTLFGPKAAGAWPAGVQLAASGGAIEERTCVAPGTNNVVVTSTATRFIFCNLNGGTPGASSPNLTTVNFVLPSAASYPVSSVVTFQLVGGTGSGVLTGNFTFTSASSFFYSNNTGGSGVSVNTAYAPSPTLSATNASFRVVSDGVSKWYRVL